ncbi:MAG: hypothetical protein K6T31_08225 [Alicyclobacillus sp.]|nr:hypothetical protein [Alicyclobacillus sp.]
MQERLSDQQLIQLLIKAYAGKTVAILGYRDPSARYRADLFRRHGIPVLIGLRPGDEAWQAAEQDGFAVLPVWEAVERAQVCQSY